VIDPERPGVDQVFFGATVAYRDGRGLERTVAIVGQDEVDSRTWPHKLDFTRGACARKIT
jgi:transcription elongation GreA/GreB family factor